MTTMDEKLSAYLDDMLPEDERAGLEALLAADPALAERLEALALANSEFVSRAAEIRHIEMSDGLKRQLASLEAAASASDNRVVPFRGQRSLAGALVDHRAMAACAAVVAGFFAWQLLQPASPPSGGFGASGLVFAGSSLDRLLEDAPSGTGASAAEGNVRFSFAAADGSYCRVADLSEGGAGSRLVACREDEGWRVVVAAYTAAPETPQTDVYRTASNEAARSIEAVLDTLMADAPMGVDEEAHLIRNRWKQR